MNKAKIFVDPVHVACGVCLREVPYTEAQHDEGSDYVLHFCGLECYKIWRKQHKEDQ